MNDLEQAIKVLTDNLEFFAAPFNDPDNFQDWAKGNSKKINELSSDLQVALKNPAELAQFKQVLLFIQNRKNTSFHNYLQSLENYLSNQPALVAILIKHAANPVITDWYHDHPKACAIHYKRLKQDTKDKIIDNLQTLPYILSGVELNICKKEIFANTPNEMKKGNQAEFSYLFNDIIRNVKIDGRPIKEYINADLLNDYIHHENKKNTQAISKQMENILIEKFTYAKFAKLKYYKQSLPAMGFNAVSQPLAQLGIALIKVGTDISLDFEGNELYLNSCFKLSYRDHNDPEAGEKPFPGTIKTRLKLTDEGFVPEHINVSNHLLYQCLWNDNIALGDKTIYQAIRLAHAEEQFHNSVHKLKEQALVFHNDKFYKEAETAHELSVKLTKKARQVFKSEKNMINEANNFIQEAKQDIRPANAILSKHRSWKGIAADIAFALTGIGAVIMGIKKAVTGVSSVFRTQSSKKLKEVEQSMKALQKAVTEKAVEETIDTLQRTVASPMA